jgi:hypothetical protein
LELNRKRGIIVPSPPPPTFPHNFLNNKVLFRNKIGVEAPPQYF